MHVEKSSWRPKEIRVNQKLKTNKDSIELEEQSTTTNKSKRQRII
jgi:hypothetical protein